MRAGLLRPGTGAVPRHARSRPGLSQGIRRQLGSGRHDRAGERAGYRRQGLAVRRPGRKAQAVPMVPQDHTVRGRSAGRPQDARPVARKGEADAGKLDRQVGGIAVPLQAGCARRRNRGAGGFLDPARHDLRRQLCGRRGGSPDRIGAGGKGCGARRLRGGMPPDRHGRCRDRNPGEEGIRHRPVGDPPLHRAQAAAVRGEFRADGLWHRRRHGGSGP